MSTAPVRVGQLWANCDRRTSVRRIRVIGISMMHALCKIEVKAQHPNAQCRIDRPAGWTAVGLTTRIRIDRFKPGSTGYRLVEDAAPSSGVSAQAA